MLGLFNAFSSSALSAVLSGPLVTLYQVPGQMKAATSQASVLKAARFPEAGQRLSSCFLQ